MNTVAQMSSNRPVVTSRSTARDIFYQFVTPINHDIRAVSFDKGTIKLKYAGWPIAVRHQLLAENLEEHAREEILRQHGDAGWLEFLAAFAPLLESELKVQAFALTLDRDGKMSARVAEWIVRPKTAKVEVKEIAQQ